MIRALLRLYPAPWRARYGDEFQALLEERPLGPFDVADLLLGAFDAQLHLRGLGAYAQHQRGYSMTLRIGGYAAILGSILWATGIGVASGAAETSSLKGVGVIGMLLGSTLLLVALTGLSAFQARRYPRLMWLAFVLPAVGAIASVVGVIGMSVMGDQAIVGDMSGWSLWAIGSLTL
ncbi:MAG: hypothetical protein ABIP77_00205, partial [Candidatus Limnocylindrales bacterium]